MNKDIFGIERSPENNSGYNQKLLDLLRSHNQGWYIANGVGGYLYNGIIKLLEDTFYSGINYWSPKHGWSDNAFEEFLNDKLTDYNKDEYVKWFWGKRKRIYKDGDVKVAVRVYDSSNRLVLENIEHWSKFDISNVNYLEMHRVISYNDTVIKLESNTGEHYDKYYVEMINVANISDLKHKIKVYIKEPNMPEYIQLWDKFTVNKVKKKINKLISNKYVDFKITGESYVNNTFSFTLRDKKTLKQRIVITFKTN